MLSLRTQPIARGFVFGVVSVGAFGGIGTIAFGDFSTSAVADSAVEVRKDLEVPSLESLDGSPNDAETFDPLTTHAIPGLDDWNASPAPWSWLEARSNAPRQRRALSWSPHAPLDVFASHPLADRVWLEARAALVPDADLWAGLLSSGGGRTVTGESFDDVVLNGGLAQAEASLAFVAEFGPRRVSPWRVALGGGWSQSDQDFSSALQGMTSANSESANDGEATIWLRFSREF
jgi:hypothetical protein